MSIASQAKYEGLPFFRKNLHTTHHDRMRVAYLISSTEPGRAGGHYYSLKATCECICKILDVMVIEIGRRKTGLFTSQKYTSSHVYFDGTIAELWGAFTRMRKVLDGFKADILHSFDAGGMFFAKIYCITRPRPLVHTKCGGSNPTGYFPLPDTIISFSAENYDYFISKTRFNVVKVYHLPNRVRRIKKDSEAAETVRQATENLPVFCRISRIDMAYLPAALQTIRLVGELQQRGHEIACLIVGFVEEDEARIAIEEAGRKIRHFVFWTEKKYTKNASRWLWGTDFVVGTGRNLMEAASAGKVILAPVDGGRLPTIVDKTTFEKLFYTNFSLRYRPDDATNEYEIETLNKLEGVLSDKKNREKLRQYTLEIFEKWFNANVLKERLPEIYQKTHEKKKLWRFNLELVPMYYLVFRRKSSWIEATRRGVSELKKIGNLLRAEKNRRPNTADALKMK